MSTETTLPLDEVSSATKGVLVVAGVSVILLVTVLGVIISRCVSKVLEFLPKSSSKGKSGAKGKARSSGGGAAPQPNPAEGAERARGPDLKSLIKEQQKASSKKTAVKDDQASHHPLFLNTLKGHGDVVHSVAWNAAGTHLLSACEDMYVRLWDLIDVTSKEPKFKRIKTAKLPLGAAWGDGPDAVMVLMKGVPDAQVAGYAPATSKEAGGTYEQQWLVSNVHGKEAPLAMASACGSTAAARRSLAISCSARKEARIYNAQGREVGLCEPNSLINHDVTMSPDGRFVAVAGFTAEVKIWEIKWAKDTGDCKGAFKALELKGHKSQVQCVAFSPDSQRVVTASKDGTLRVWNINVRYAQEEDPKTLLVIPQPLATGRLYQHLAYGPTGVIAASWEGQVHLLSAANGEMLDSIDAHESSITDAEEAPNSVIQRAILTYINKTMPEITRHWTSAEVEARRATRNLAKAANNDDDCGSTDSDEEGDEAPQYHYLVSPPPEQFVQITADVELMVEDVRRAQENNNNGGNSNQKDRTIVFTLRSMKPKSAQLIEDFIQRALDFHNQRLKDSIDSARYLYVPVLGGGKSGEDGGSGAKVSYHRYRLDEQRTFESFFHPEKQGVINLVQAFQNKTGKFSIPGYPQKLGFLLHGPPGTGKTSFIKALAQHTGRHIVSIPLSRIKTNQELMDLMTEQRVHLLGADDSTAPSTLPFKKVIYVMEDVDAASQVVRRRVDAQSPTPARMTNPAVSSLEGCELPQRDVLSPSTPPLPQGGTATPSAQAGAACREPSLGPSPLEMQLLITQMQLQEKLADKQAGSSEEEIQVLAAGMEMGPVAPNSKSGWYKDLLKGSSDDKLNLAGLLNTLDGVVDTPERIVVMTTNWPEHLDPALIRPGRINKQIYLGHLRVEEALMMINHYFVVDHAAGKADAEAGDAAMVPDAASDAGQAQMAAELRGIWMDGQVTPAELECMCAEHDNLAGLLEALRARFIGCQQ